jgi:hypothetical protein
MSGTPLWLRSKCKPLGVIIPCSRCGGARAAPEPGAFGGSTNTRATPASKHEGWP